MKTNYFMTEQNQEMIMNKYKKWKIDMVMHIGKS